MTGLCYHPRFLEHDTGIGHPERPARLAAIIDHLKATGRWDKLTHLHGFQPVSRETLLRLHTPDYLDRLDDACVAQRSFIDTPDSRIGADSAEIAQLAVGAVLAAVDAVMERRVRNAMALVRPPGHHAEAFKSMGFCLYANAAFAADRLLDEHGLQRVAVVDFDVHHGNGTQHLFESRDDVFFASLHEDPQVQYPHTGFADERGVGAGKGCTLNVPLAPGAGEAEMLDALDAHVLPALRDYNPEALVISAGFDAHADDPLGHLEVSTTGYGLITRRLLDLANEACAGRVISVLEGGYDLDALKCSVAVHLDELMRG